MKLSRRLGTLCALIAAIAVMAMSNLPSIKFVSWNTEFGVLVSFTSTPPLAK